jgi:hypothetical protein
MTDVRHVGKPRILLGNDLDEDQQVDAVMRWLAPHRGWTEEQLREAKEQEQPEDGEPTED